jgi:hypothetical protein
MTPRFLEGYEIPGIGGQGLRGALPGAQRVARLLVGKRQEYAGVE